MLSLFRGVQVVAGLALVLAFADPACATQSGNKWETTDFEIYFIDRGASPPGDPIEVATSGRRASSPNEEQWANRVMAHLSDVAQRYEGAGFRQPFLGRAVGGPGYRVFLSMDDPGYSALFVKTYMTKEFSMFEAVESGSDYISVGKGWFDAVVAGSTPVPADSAPPPAGSDWDVLLYLTLAHELFHAVAERYAQDGGYAPYGAWDSKMRLDTASVDEGLADGMARWARDQKYPGWAEKMPSTNVNSTKHVGMYGFHHGFLFRDPATYNPANLDTLGYRTSSFWLNLVERWGPHVIQHLLARKIPDSMTTTDLVKWLDEGLKASAFGSEGLYIAYNHFLSEMAAYGEVPRYQAFAGTGFFNPVFGNPCAVTITLDPSSPATASGSHSFNLSKLGGNCIRVAWQNYAPATFAQKVLEVEVRHAGGKRAILDQINLGIAAVDLPGLGGEIPGVPPAPFQATCWKARVLAGRSCTHVQLAHPTRSTTAARTWRYDNRYVATAQGEALFVLSNVALDAAKTVDAPGLTVSFSLAATGSHTGPGRSPSELKPLQLGMPSRPDDMRLRTYGINPDPPLEQTIGGNPLAATFPPFAIPKGIGKVMDVGYYLVTPDPGRPLALGSSGPLYGAVTDMSFSSGLQEFIGLPESGHFTYSPFLRVSQQHTPAPIRQTQLRELLEGLKKRLAGTAGSMMCRSNQGRPIGQVEAYNEGLLQVRIDTDICAGVLTGGKLVERLDVTAILPFGWRYQNPAPTQEITPALEFMVDRFHDRLEGRINNLWLGAPEELDVALASRTGPADGGSGTGRAVTLPQTPETCDCSCEGGRQFEELSNRRDAAARTQMEAIMPCMRQCMTRWMSCPR